MDLPAELRLMVYKRLPRQIKHTEIRYVTGYYASTNEKIGSTVVVVTRHLPVAILRTSRQVFAEAGGIVANLIRTFVTESQPRVIGHDTDLVALQELIYLMRTERKAYLNISYILPATGMSTDQHNSFPFMRLPVELRLMIYERLPRQIKHTEISIDGAVAVLVTRHLPTAILRTSKQVHSEARTILEELVRHFIEESPTKLIELGKSGTKMRQSKVLQYFISQIPRERMAVEDDKKYDIQAILQRLPKSSGLQPIDHGATPNIARFLHQAARARYRPDDDHFYDAAGGLWNNTVVTVFAARTSYKNEEEFQCFAEINHRHIRHMYHHGEMPHFPHDIWIRDGGIIQVEGDASLERAIDKVPMLCQDGYDDWGKRTGSVGDLWGPAMRREDWDGEWLPS
ncbi:uncharacterized protein J4E78_009527 [Alternaria triticimaculans]|uniref:uncharacterized protein n=1 Tax=Alternaria triticimaculans TaxID=297637 RepID=UPI0020C2FD08|nr:uncharacterized protein J4E78_009527 [Alternaria triticimaculans]KAI4644708.1 hypothetical protein J4E78_009527 [Alternaria triticimaculans]